MYNKRTWLNKENSPSIGSVVAFDGDVKYSDGIERTTFLALSDCGKTIKLSRNTESIEDFIDKMKLLKSEIDSFIDYLTQKSAIFDVLEELKQLNEGILESEHKLCPRCGSKYITYTTEEFYTCNSCKCQWT